MISIWHLHYLVVVIFLAFSSLTTLINFILIRRFDQFPPPEEFPKVSVLVPARNEILNIESCISSLLAQDYPSFEIVVLDDQSTDGTLDTLKRAAEHDSRLMVMDGKPLPDGWLGKHWACHQLSQAATGDLFLFTDADTIHAPNMLRDSVSSLIAQKADLISAFPREKTETWAEKLIVPIISFGVFSFIPTYLARLFHWSAFSVTIGQFMLFRRQAYEAIGGYEAVRANVVDDVALGRKILKSGFNLRLMDATKYVTCRMYHNFPEVVEGFSKNGFAFFDYRIIPFLIVLAIIFFVFIEPPLALSLYWFGVKLGTFYPALSLIAVIESIILFLIAYKRFKYPAIIAFLYPLSLALIILIGFNSMVLTLTGNTSWKNRKLSRIDFRWL
jgi:chlorobactene glucosyltransferase